MRLDNPAVHCGTYATLVVETGEMAPEFVGHFLSFQPSLLHHKGKVPNGRRNKAPYNAWYLTTLHHVQSHDARCHVDWLLDALIKKEDELRQITTLANRVFVSLTWLGNPSRAQPKLSPTQMRKLVRLDLDITWQWIPSEAQDVEANQAIAEAQ
ncbi:DUF4279 domain-containing protein [Thaumasiovibrio subtropicus]|uniref:DUF4279 domain-containing protein n=1 Tax=Thaumasiovibrio subtropicus TaxID=1891207 RepID=UPI000B34AB76|nr:DUF4279 domain-containing protein [Thaumasiovibrio subtropicus]